MEFDWARLPEDVLFDIALKFESIKVLVVFSAVCSSWRDVYAKVKYVWTPKMPWLILSETKIDVHHPKKRRKSDNHLCLRYVFDPNVGVIHQLRLPRTFGRRCWGCADGWICTLGIDMEFDLINPLANKHLSLPSAKTLPFVEPGEVYYYEFAELLRRKYIKRVHLFTIPPNNEIVVIVVYTIEHFENWVAFARPGDSMWKSLEHAKFHNVLDVASFEGHIVVLYKDGKLALLDMDVFQHRGHKAFKDEEFVPTSKKRFKGRTYLVESFGKLLSVERVDMQDVYNDVFVVDDEEDEDEDDVGDDYEEDDENDEEEEEDDDDDDENDYDDEDYDDDVDHDEDDEEDDDDYESYDTISHETQVFNVHMFDFEARQWIAVDDFEDAALFVGNNSTVSLRVSEAVNCNQNCIYFTDDKPYDRVKRYQGRDMGIYDLRGRKFIGNLYDGKYILSKFCPPFWYMPKLV